MPTILDKIVATKREEIDAGRRVRSPEELRRELAGAPAVRDFVGALRRQESGGKGLPRLIAEVKKASPSAGVIREDFDPVAIATIYAQHGASCLSVLTDVSYFEGHLDFLRDIRQEVEIPVLRKDFLIDEYQVLEARVAGADAVLLIAECLDRQQLADLYAATRELGMEALIELYDPANLDAVLATGCPLVGVNNRNLHTFEVRLERTLELRRQIPDDRLVVGESGIGTHEDVKRLGAGGVDAILVGESLMRQTDIGRAVELLLTGR
jgi:indole-3-glycerol phosphate synthase